MPEDPQGHPAASPAAGPGGTRPGAATGTAGSQPPADVETEIPLRPLGISELLDGAITYIRRNPRATLGMSAILTSVVQVAVTVAQYFLLGGEIRGDVTPGALSRSLGPAFITMLGGLVLTAYAVLLLAGFLAPVMGRTLLGGSASFGRAWRDARPSLARLAGAASTVLVAVLIAVALPLAPLVAGVAAGAPDAVQAIAAILGVPVAAIAMVVCYVWFALSTPLLVLERRPVFASLRRSAEIVRGHWWRLLGTLALALLITVFVEFLVLPVPFAIAQQIILAFDHEPSGWLLVAVVAVGGIGRIIAGTLVNPFNAGVIALVYADRRMRREAFDLELQTRPPDDPVAAWLPGPLTAAGAGPQPKVARRPYAMAPPPQSRPMPPPPPPPPPPHQQAPPGPPGWHR